MLASARSCLVSILALAAACAAAPAARAADGVAPTRAELAERFLAMIPEGGVLRWQVPIRVRVGAALGSLDGAIGRKLAVLAQVTRREIGLAGGQTANLVIARSADLPALRAGASAQERRLLPTSWDGRDCTLRQGRDGPRGISSAFVGIPDDAPVALVQGCIAYGLFAGLGFTRGRVAGAYSVANAEGQYLDLTPQDLVLLRLLYSGHVSTGMTAAAVRSRAWDGLVADARLDGHWQALPAAFEETLLINVAPNAARTAPPVPVWTRAIRVGVEGRFGYGLAFNLAEFGLRSRESQPAMDLIAPHVELLQAITGLDAEVGRLGLNVLVHFGPFTDDREMIRLYDRMRGLFASRQELTAMIGATREGTCESRLKLDNAALILVNRGSGRPVLGCIKAQLNAALYPTGAFVRSDWSSFPQDSAWAELTPLDLALLRLAYHPRMRAARTADEARAVAAALIPEMARDTARPW